MIRIIDVETTGFEEDDEIVEVACVDLVDDRFVSWFSDLVKPTKPIPAEAAAIHHITDLMVADARSWAAVAPSYAGATTYCAHNAQFDQRFLKFEGDWICTYKCALRVWPDAPNHKNQTLRYHLDAEPNPVHLDGLAPHRALYDCFVTGKILLALSMHLNFQQMVDISSEPALLPKVGFGKHFGTQWSDVPKDYLHWILSQDFDEDVMHTARHWLEAGGEAQ